MELHGLTPDFLFFWWYNSTEAFIVKHFYIHFWNLKPQSMIFEIGTKKWCHIPTEDTIFTRAASKLHKRALANVFTSERRERLHKQGFRERWSRANKSLHNPNSRQRAFFTCEHSERLHKRPLDAPSPARLPGKWRYEEKPAAFERSAAGAAVKWSLAASFFCRYKKNGGGGWM